MTENLAIWLLIALALFSANLPFLSERVFALFAWRRASTGAVKPFWVRAAELIVLYFIVGAIGFAFESSIGNRFDQGWEFYAITFSLYLVLAYPGFVYRYLFQRHGKVRN
jgi:hypothetical protein